MQSISDIMLSQVTDILSVKFSFLLKSVHEELVNKYDISEDDMIDIWCKISPDIKLNFKKDKSNIIINNSNNSNKNIDCDDCCIFIFKKGGRKGERCDRKKAKKSSLGYCSIHIKEESEDSKNSKEDIESKNKQNKNECTSTCCFTFKKGPKKGDYCTNKVSKSSNMGYCIVHKKEELNNTNNDKKIVSKDSDTEDSDLPYIVKKNINIKDAVKKVTNGWSDCEPDDTDDSSSSESDDECFKKT